MTRAPDPGPTHERPWWEDPLELDRTLEGQLDAETLAARRAQLADAPDPVAARRAFLERLGEAGAAWRAETRVRMPEALESRVRFRLRRDRARRGALRWAAAAAVLCVALGAWLLPGSGGEATAMPDAVIRAADALRGAPGPGTCDPAGEAGPAAFPPVRAGDLRIRSCREEEGGTVATLYRPEELPSAGYAAVAEPGVERGPDLGMTDLGDVVVFDLVYGRTRHYLAVGKGFLEAQERLHPGRASCRACHNRSREGQPNPHNIVRRSWRPGG